MFCKSRSLQVFNALSAESILFIDCEQSGELWWSFGGVQLYPTMMSILMIDCILCIFVEAILMYTLFNLTILATDSHDLSLFCTVCS